MISLNEKTDHEIYFHGLEALRKELGVTGLIRFLQQLTPGYGDYTKDRHQWQENYTVDSIAQSLQKSRK